MHDRINTHDSRVIMGIGGRLPSGKWRVHIKELRVGDVLEGGFRITKLDRENAQPGRVILHTEPADPDKIQTWDHTFDEEGVFDWSLETLTTRLPREDEE